MAPTKIFFLNREAAIVEQKHRDGTKMLRPTWFPGSFKLVHSINDMRKIGAKRGGD
jgi:hypothetical protein